MSDLNIIDNQKAVKPKKKKNLLIKFSAVLCSIAVLGGIGYTVYFIDAQQKERLAIQNAAKEMPMPDIPKPILRMEDYDPDRLIYQNDRTYKMNNSRLTELNQVPLTSAAHPMERLGSRVAENLLALINNPNLDATYEFVPELAVRDSAVKNR